MIKIIAQNYCVRPWSKNLSPFEVIVSTILSQATERRGNIKAFENLKDKFEMTPESFLQADITELAECIRPAGLHSAKASKLKRLAEVLLHQYEGDLMKILRLPEDEARKELMKLPGVGPKTADVLLNFVAGRDVFPVDTHIIRIARRLGMVGRKASYDEIKKAFERVIPAGERRRVHLALIEFGRNVCRARPRCEACPIFSFCGKLGL
ncbi:MAG: endonuclease III [Actinomycetota bacterium]|nr:endonuclease III [Actinomycetota bacterium]MDI6822634.1 endonuclease III [Actinomycetota bacterium]